MALAAFKVIQIRARHAGDLWPRGPCGSICLGDVVRSLNLSLGLASFCDEPILGKLFAERCAHSLHVKGHRRNYNT